MRVLVTGGTGFVGSHTTVALLKAGHDVRLLVRSPEKMKKIFDDLDVTITDYVKGDVTDADCVKAALSGCDAVVHSAAMVSTDKNMAELVHNTNVNGTKNVLGQAIDLGLKQIVHVSSITAVFDPNVDTVDENSPPGKAQNAYGRSKVECEHYVRSLQDAGHPVAITLPTAIIGPQDPTYTEPLEGLALLLKVGAVTTTGIQYIDVRDLAEIHVKIIDSIAGAERYMVGGVYFEWKNLIDTLEELTERRIMRVYLPPKVMHAIGRLVDFCAKFGVILSNSLTAEAAVYATNWCVGENTKVENELGFEYRCGKKTLSETLIWMEKAGHVTPRHIGALASTEEIDAQLLTNT